MTDQNSGHSGQRPGDDQGIRFAENWWDIPAENLWLPLSRLCTGGISQNDVAKRVGLSKEAVRKIIMRESVPKTPTRKVLGELLLEMFPGGITVEGTVVQPDDDEKQWKMRERLISLLPKGEQEARDEIARLFELARQNGDAPAWLDEVEHWLDLQVRGEYWGERQWGPRKGRVPDKGSAGKRKEKGK